MSENVEVEETQSVTEPLAPASEVPEPPVNSGELPETPTNPEEVLDKPAEDDPESFPRSYVEKLRKEAAGHRDRAKRADDLAQRLHTAIVGATGRLADATDLPYEESHLDDPAALTRAIDGLLADKPHLASRKPMGNIGQGATSASDTVDLAGLLRANAS